MLDLSILHEVFISFKHQLDEIMVNGGVGWQVQLELRNGAFIRLDGEETYLIS